jgi:hypothetical protein
MIVTPLSKNSKIPAEERSTAEVLTSLPENWLCICGDKDTYFSFIKNNKKIRGTQIDFVIINQYGVFFLEVKNVSLIKSEHNNLIFQSQNKDEYDPLYRAIEYPNLAKNWFLDKFREGKISNHLYKKTDLKFGIWGMVVISNDNYRIVSPQKELKLEDIIHHKQMNIIHRKELKASLFKKFYQQRKAPHHEKLSQEDLFLLFHFLLNQNLPIDSVLTPETERTYQILKYQSKYKTANIDKSYDNQKIIDSLKEEKEELESKLTITRQEYEKIIEEHKIDIERLHDREKMQTNMESKIEKLTDEKAKLENKNKQQEKIIDTEFDAIFNAVRSTIREKIKSKDEKTKLNKKILQIKNIKVINYILIPVLILSIIAIIILSNSLSSEMSKTPPTPSEIFNDSYVRLRELFNQNQYKELIQTYESMDYSFEFLTSPEVIEFRYFIGYSYFRTGKEDAGVTILMDIKPQILTTKQIFDIYPDLYDYLWKFNRYSEAGKILSIIEETLDERENTLLNEEKGLYQLIDGKILLIKALDNINLESPSQLRVMDYLGAELINKSYIIEDYLTHIYNYIDSRVLSHISKLSNSEYPPIQSNKILDDYLIFNNYINQVKDMELNEYETVRIRYTKLYIRINSEIGRIYSINQSKYEKAIQYLKKATLAYNEINQIYKPTSISDISIYTNMFLLMGKAYEVIGDLCSAFEAYWNAEKLAKKIASTYPGYPQILAKVETMENQIEENEVIGGLENCTFESAELQEKYSQP